MPLIRDTINPLRERQVSDEEATDLERYGVLLTGTRAKTPDGLTAAAVRQVTEQMKGTAPAVPTVDNVEDQAAVVVDGTQTPGDAPDSTTTTATDSQES